MFLFSLFRVVFGGVVFGFLCSLFWFLFRCALLHFDSHMDCEKLSLAAFLNDGIA